MPTFSAVSRPPPRPLRGEIFFFFLFLPPVLGDELCCLLLLGDGGFVVVVTGDTDEAGGSKAESDPSSGHSAGLVKEAGHSSFAGDGDGDIAIEMVVLGEVGVRGTPVVALEG